jgi:lipopolysaccharide assembly outer membrane protein LptD (OstA)
LFLSAENGNISIIASNGKIRLQGTDIELIAVGEGGSKGNIRLSATENIEMDSKKFLVNAKVNYKIATPGTGEVISNGILKMYGSVIKGVSDAVAVKDSKNGGKNYQQKQNQL